MAHSVSDTHSHPMTARISSMSDTTFRDLTGSVCETKHWQYDQHREELQQGVAPGDCEAGGEEDEDGWPGWGRGRASHPAGATGHWDLFGGNWTWWRPALPSTCKGCWRTRPPSIPIWFVPQKLGLIWWVPWECKNLGELNFHMENGLPEAQKLPNRYYHMSRSQENWSEFFFVHYWGCGRHFSGGDRSDLLKRGELLHMRSCLILCKESDLALGREA